MIFSRASSAAAARLERAELREAQRSDVTAIHAKLAERDARIAELEALVAALEATVAAKDALLQEKDDRLKAAAATVQSAGEKEEVVAVVPAVTSEFDGVLLEAA